MYKLLLGILFLLISEISFGQQFSLQELIKINNNNWDDFDTDATTKGYSYFRTTDDWFSESKAYAFGRHDSTALYFISKSIYKSDSSEMVAFQTNESKHYVAIKDQLKKKGFKYVDMETIDNGTIFLKYTKENLTVSLATYQAKNRYGELFTSYEISVTKKKAF